MTCEHFSEIVPLLINGSLEGVEEKEAFEHLIICADCREELAFWSQIAASQHGEPMGSVVKNRIAKRVIHQDDAWDVTRKAVGLYFKVIKGVFNLG